MEKDKKFTQSIDDYSWYDWSKKIKSHFEESYQYAKTPSQRETIAHEAQEALWGLDIATEEDLKIANSKISDYTGTWYFFNIGRSTRKIKEFQQKLRPFLIVGALFSAGLAWHNHSNNIKTNPAMGIAAGLMAVAALSQIWQNSLPPYPEKPIFKALPQKEPQNLEQTQRQLQKTLMEVRKQQLDEIRKQMVNKELDTDELLVVELSRYEQKKKDLDKASFVIEKLSPQEASQLTPYLKQPQDLLNACLELAEKKEQQQKGSRHFKRSRRIKKGR